MHLKIQKTVVCIHGKPSSLALQAERLRKTVRDLQEAAESEKLSRETEVAVTQAKMQELQEQQAGAGADRIAQLQGELEQLQEQVDLRQKPTGANVLVLAKLLEPVCLDTQSHTLLRRIFKGLGLRLFEDS